MNIVLLEDLEIPQETLEGYERKLTEAGHSFKHYPKSLDSEVNKERSKDAEVIIVGNTPIGAEIIESNPNLKYIDVAFTGLDHIALDAAKEKGVIVSNAAGYSTEAVAELAIAMMIMILRDIDRAQELTRAGKNRQGLKASLLQSKTVGIIGVGAIGTRVAELLNAFGCRILGYKRHVTGEEPSYIKFTSLDNLLAESDIVTLHCPLTVETRALIDAEAIAKMKEGAILINTARGPVVDAQAVASALEAGALAGVGVDVYDAEPPLGADNPFLESPNTIATPHIGYVSNESMLKRAEIVFEKLEAFLNGDGESINVLE